MPNVQLMLGAAGLGTGLHVDWTNAINFALALDDNVKLGSVVGE